MVFGGGWCWCCSGQLEPYWQHFTAQGFVCVLPDYRLVACGSAKAGCIEEKCIPDVKSAVRWVRTKADSLGIDSHRIIGMGWSAGGHLAAAAAVFAGMENPGEDLAVSSRPDLLALFYPVLTFDPSTRGTIFKDMMRDTTAIAPALHLSVSTPPTLIMVGSRDDYFGGDTVFMRNAKALRLDAVMKVAPGAGHDFANSGSGLDSCKAWCTEFFKARAFCPR